MLLIALWMPMPSEKAKRCDSAAPSPDPFQKQRGAYATDTADTELCGRAAAEALTIEIFGGNFSGSKNQV